MTNIASNTEVSAADTTKTMPQGTPTPDPKTGQPGDQSNKPADKPVGSK